MIGLPGLGTLGFVAVLLLILAAHGALAATSTPASRAAPGPAQKAVPSNFDREWAELVAAAKREGKLMMNPPPTWQRLEGLGQVFAAFEKEFGIKVLTSRGTGAAQAERVLAERRARIYNSDIFIGGAATFGTLLSAKALDPIKPLLFHPEVVDRSLWKGGVHRYLDAAQEFVFIYGARNAPIGISINTQLVRPGEIKSFWDLMNPKWKGKVVAYQPRTAQAGVTYSQVYWNKDLGPEFLRRIYSWDGIRFVTTTREFSDGLAAGAYAIGFLEGPAQREIRSLESQGLPVKMLMGQDVGVKVPSASPGGASTFAVVNRAANPNARKLFVNWLLMRRVQHLFNRHGEGEYESLRADVPNDDVQPLYRIPKNFYLAEADPESQKKEEIAVKFVRQLINELGL